MAALAATLGHAMHLIEEVPDTMTLDALWASGDAPGRVVLLGKGPSLSKYEPAEFEGEVVVGINEASESFPCQYAFFIDKRQEQLTIEPPKIPCRPDVRWLAHGRRGYAWRRKKEPILPRLFKHTAVAALSIFGHWGTKEFLMVGFDGYDSADAGIYWDGLKIFRPRKNAKYDTINKKIDMAAREYDLQLYWFHRGERFDAGSRVVSQLV